MSPPLCPDPTSMPRSPADTEVAAPSGILRLAGLWWPTALGSSLLAWEIPVVVAIIGRMADGAEAMAAFGAALSVLVVVNSPALALAPLVVAVSDSHGARALRRQSVLTGVAGGLALVGLALVPTLSTAFPAVLGLPQNLWPGLRLCLLSLASAPLAVASRRLSHGLLIWSDNTSPIGAATAVRIVVTLVMGLTAAAVGLPAVVVGGLSLSAGAWAEALALAVVCRGQAPDLRPSPAPADAPLLNHHARLSLVALLNMAPALVTTMIIARSQDPSWSLIVWPALFGLVSLGTIPMSDLDSVGAAHLRHGGSWPALRRFALALAAALLAVMLLVAVTPLSRWYLEDFSSVPRGPAELGASWLAPLALAPSLWALRGARRAILLADGATHALPRAAGVHLVALVGTGTLLAGTALPGVACAGLAVVCALALETTGLRLMGGPRR